MTISSHRAVFRRLYAQHGPQHWWPADGPFEVMVGAVLTQNTAWRNVVKAMDNLRAAGALEPGRLAEVATATLADWIRPTGYFNVKARRLQAFCRWYLAQGGYEALGERSTADLRRGLLAVPGVGAETADDMLLYAFHRPVFVIDAYTRRILARLGLAHGAEGYEDLRRQTEEALTGIDRHRQVALFNEYHALLVRHGNEICRPQPRCSQCALAPVCPEAEGRELSWLG